MFPTELSLSQEEMTRIFTDVARLKTLYAISQLPGKQGFYDWFTATLHELLDVPGAAISLVAEDRLYFQSQYGAEPKSRSLDLNDAVCTYTATNNQLLVVSDAKAHARLKDVGIVARTGLTAYLGVPITMRDGAQLGAICAFDFVPRVWEDVDVDIVREMSEIITAEFELRASVYIDRENKLALKDLRQRIEVAQLYLDPRMSKPDFLSALRSARRENSF